MAFTYYLPDATSNKVEHRTDINSVVIIGANGSGKSKLGAWIEQQDFAGVHRIGAQRSLNFNENIALKSYSQAEDLVFYGSEGSGGYKTNKGARWGWGNDVKFTTQLLDDFENVLAALIALKNNEHDKYVSECKDAERNNRAKPNVSETVIDKLQRVWDYVLPHRSLILEDSKFFATFERDGTLEKYSATQMSDGERSVLYLTAQVLCVPQSKTMIIDEPELHLHRSIMNRLWTALEQLRTDCLFIYITHDTDFAASHGTANKFWIKEYNGQHWEFEELNDTDLPENLLLDVMGNRKNILFVEGEKNSYDSQLYAELFPNYYVIPCGSCTQVVARTKVFKNNPVLHHCQVYGLIDRDFRSDYEISAYQSDNIYTLSVAEVENLFLVEELIRWFAEHMGKDPDEVFNSISNYVINDRFANQIQSQTCQSVVAQIKYKLTSAEISKKNETEAKNTLNEAIAAIDYEAIKATEQARFISAKNGSYADVIKVFNEKNIAKSVGRFFGLSNDAYCSTIVSLIKGAKKAEIIAALVPYLPTEIPIN